MKVTRFHHVSVNTNSASLGAMVDFYRDVLGLGDEARPDIPGVPGHWHRVGDQQLHLVGAPPSGTAIDPTGHHYCVAVDDLDAAIAELDERGIAYRRALQGEHTVQIWINDPAGNTIELQQDTAHR
jgi:catechol 2,3-dioxygenase-like lactoylglutathione lyase family enzyme